MRSAKRLALAVGLVSAVALGFLAGAGLALADEPTGSTAVTMTFERAQASEEEGGISISVRLATAEDEAISGQPVEFSVTPDFFGERSMPLRTVLTDARGRATLRYAPTWEGEHRITASFAGNETYQPTEATSVLELSGVPSGYTPPPTPLNPLRQWATPGAVVVVLAVWLTLAVVLVRVGWGIWQTGRRREVRIPSPPERTAEGLPRGTYSQFTIGDGADRSGPGRGTLWSTGKPRPSKKE